MPIIDMKQKGEPDIKRYTDPDTNVYKARFSRGTYPETAVDPETEASLMKKEEAWLKHLFQQCLIY